MRGRRRACSASRASCAKRAACSESVAWQRSHAVRPLALAANCPACGSRWQAAHSAPAPLKPERAGRGILRVRVAARAGDACVPAAQRVAGLARGRRRPGARTRPGGRSRTRSRRHRRGLASVRVAVAVDAARGRELERHPRRRCRRGPAPPAPGPAARWWHSSQATARCAPRRGKAVFAWSSARSGPDESRGASWQLSQRLGSAARRTCSRRAASPWQSPQRSCLIRIGRPGTWHLSQATPRGAR